MRELRLTCSCRLPRTRVVQSRRGRTTCRSGRYSVNSSPFFCFLPQFMRERAPFEHHAPVHDGPARTRADLGTWLIPCRNGTGLCRTDAGCGGGANLQGNRIRNLSGSAGSPSSPQRGEGGAQRRMRGLSGTPFCASRTPSSALRASSPRWGEAGASRQRLPMPDATALRGSSLTPACAPHASAGRCRCAGAPRHRRA